MKKIGLLILAAICQRSVAQNVGIGTTTPQATLDVYGNQRLGGFSKYTTYDSVTGRITWANSALFVSSPQYLLQHSASAEGLFYGNSKLLYRGLTDTAFYTDWSNGNGYFKGLVGIGTTTPGTKLHVLSGASGYTGSYFPGIALEGSGNTYLNIITPNNNEGAVLFGKATDGASGGIVYNNSGAFNGLQFRTNGNVNRMVITQTGNVGIGTLIPSEKLEVNGNIKTATVKFTTPKTYYYSLDQSAFTARDGSKTVQKSFGGGGAFMSPGDNYGIVAPVTLPHGAEITKLTITFYDNSTTQDLKADFMTYYGLGSGGFGSIATVSSSGSSGTQQVSQTLSPAIVVNDMEVSYSILVYPTSGNWNGFDIMIRSVFIEYRLSEL